MSETGRIPQPGDVLGDKYVVEGVLGQGGMGLVFAARNNRTHRRVAIKWLLPKLLDNPSALKRFEREAHVAGSIDHPNVVNVYDVERDRQTTYIVMELLEGQSLAQRLSGQQCMPLSDVAAIFMPVLRGVSAAHAAGVVHRDLKPDNVFLCRSKDGSAEVPKVLDFGISKIAEREHNATTLTQDGTLLGTFLYMSPEQLRGHATDQRTDVFALGVIFYRMLSGEMPFRGNNAIDLALNIASSLPVPLKQRGASLPEGLDLVVCKALARDVGERFGSVEEFGHALEPYLPGHVFRPGDSGSGRPIAVVRSPRFLNPLQSVEATPFAAGNRPRAITTGLRWSVWRSMLVATVAAAVGFALWSSRTTSPQPPPHAASGLAPAAFRTVPRAPVSVVPSPLPVRTPEAPSNGWTQVEAPAEAPAATTRAVSPSVVAEPAPTVARRKPRIEPSAPPRGRGISHPANSLKHPTAVKPDARDIPLPDSPARQPRKPKLDGDRSWMQL